jgi:Subtilase family
MARTLVLGAMLARAVVLPSPLLATALGGGLVNLAFAEDGSSGGGEGGGEGGGGSGGGGEGGSDGGSNAGSDGGDDSGAESPGGENGASNGDQAPGGGGHSRFEPSEVVVVADRPDILPKARRMGFRLIDERPLVSLGILVLRLKTPVYIEPARALTMLHRAFPKVTADVNTLYEPYQTQSANVFSLPGPDYARRMIRWSGGDGCGAGLRVGMIDTGVAVGLPALAGRKLHQQSFLTEESTAAEPDHGTAIAALLVGRADPSHPEAAGLLPGADLYAAGIFEKHGERTEASAVAIAVALDWMVSNHVPLVNVSLAGDYNALMALAVRRAAESGTVLVAAAGNGGPAAAPAYPGALAEVIAVTAVDQDDAVLPEANRGDYIAFAAPGVRIWTPTPDELGQYQTGTSFATPFAVAAAALELMSAAPAEPAELRRRLASHAQHLGPAGRNPIFGYGLVRAATSCGASAR